MRKETVNWKAASSLPTDRSIGDVSGILDPKDFLEWPCDKGIQWILDKNCLRWEWSYETAETDHSTLP